MALADIFKTLVDIIGRKAGDSGYNAKTVDLVHPKTIATINPSPVVVAPPASPPKTLAPATGARYGDLFDRCFAHAMFWESGRKMDLADPRVIAGDISTPQGRLLCGYTDGVSGASADDHGGETKFGVAQKAHPEVNVRTLTLAQAEKIYYEGYFLPVRGPEMPGLIGPELFDIACGSGPRRAILMLQQALGVPADGAIGPMTMAAVTAANPQELFNKILDLRRAFYRSIATGTQAKFLNGWLNRANDVAW